MEKVITQSKIAKSSRYAGRKMSPKQFLAWQKPVNQWNYEYFNGQIELKSRMKNAERYIVDNLLRKFISIPAFQTGSLLPETDCWLSPTQMWRPDIAYFTKDQIKLSAQGQEPIPNFVVEIISPTDIANQIERKLQEYFGAGVGVGVVWHIYPDLQQVKVYTALREVKICYENDICSAEPLIPELNLSVNDLFKI